MAGVAKPGDLTCIRDSCAMSGLVQLGRGDGACVRCGGELARVPAPASGPPHLVVDERRLAWRAKPLGVRLAIGLLVGVVVVCGLFLIRNLDFLNRFTGHAYKVGDCARVQPRLRGDYTMVHADCTANTFSSTDLVYQVVSVQDGKDGSCPVSGLGGITFSDEPEDTTYCLRVYMGR